MKWVNFNSDWQWWKDGREAQKQSVHLPHDAMLTEKRIPKLTEGAASGYFPGGKYIYEKKLFGDSAWEGKSVVLEFEGVYQKASVYLNDELVAGQIYEYTNFYADLTDKILIGQDNMIRVIADNSQTPNSRWYTGSGIYRPVHLVVGNKAHILPNGIKVVTKSIHPAVIGVRVETTSLPEGVDIVVHVVKDGKKIASGQGISCEITIENALLWSAETPNLYELEVELRSKEDIIDTAREIFGIRKLEWDTKRGLLCNGTDIKLRGGCIHHDNGPLGACEFEESAFRRIRIMKQAGYNAVRSSHNPISKALLRACDTLGMYVMDESFDIWLEGKNDYDYSLYFEKEWKKDIQAMIEKDFNHPCVVMYSIGNEIIDIINKYGIELHKEMIAFCRKLDPTRPSTNALTVMAALAKVTDKPKPTPKVSIDDIVDPCREVTVEQAKGSKKINQMVTMMPFIISMIKPKNVIKTLKEVMDHEDIVGFNYGDGLMESLHEVYPDRLIVNTETYPKNIGKNWPVVMRNKHVVGDFMWTGWDYLGEAGIGVVLYGRNPLQFNKPYPCIAGGIGSIDMTGRMESQGYYTATVFGQLDKPYIAVRPVNHAGERVQMGQWRGTDTVHSWTWPGCEGKKAEIEIYSQGASVELFLNGSSLGKQPVKDYMAKFKTKYMPGTLKAVSYDATGKVIANAQLKTAGKETILSAKPEKAVLKANGEDLAYIDIAITDADGIEKNLEERKVQVKVEGTCVLQAVGSGNPVTEENYRGSSFTTYNGHMLAVVRSGMMAGESVVTIKADGLKEQKITIQVISE